MTTATLRKLIGLDGLEDGFHLAGDDMVDAGFTPLSWSPTGPFLPGVNLAGVGFDPNVPGVYAPSSPTSSSLSAGPFLVGVNLAVAEFAPQNTPGTYGVDYTYPTHAEVDYYASKDLNVIRLPFLWERLQHTQNGPFDTDELARLDDVVNYATSKGLKVDIDPHNYAMGFGHLIGSAETPNSSFADLWSKLALHYKDNSDVIFGLMNEPNIQTAAEWLTSANAAIAAIRNAGATQEILVPGTHWTGGWTWTTSDNAGVFDDGVVDPLNNFAFEIHQYLDSDASGTHQDVVSETVGSERLTDVTNWAKQFGHHLFLGEVGVAEQPSQPDGPSPLAALDDMLDYIQENTDVWQGVTYWAAGPWWPSDYIFLIEPDGDLNHPESLVDKPQMAIMLDHLSSSPPGPIIGTNGPDTLPGTDDADTIQGLAGNDTIPAAGGNDTIDGGPGADTMTGGTGDDFFYVDNALDVTNEVTGGGNDRVFASVSYTLGAGQDIEKLSTTSNNGTGAVNLTGNELANIIFGNNGANSIDGKGGADNLNGMGGDDLYYVDNPLDVVNEASGDGNDRVLASVSYVLKAGQSVEKLTTTSNSGTAAINLTGNELANIVFGNEGANTLDGKGGADNLIGLGGDDFYYVDNPLDVVNEAASGGSDRVFASVSYALRAGQSVEKLTTTSNAGTGAINLTGNELADLIYGNNGTNSLDGKGGADNLNGLGGDDLYYVDSALDVVNEAVGGGNDRVLASVSYALKAGQEIEKLTTGSTVGTSAINLTGNETANIIYGNDGANSLNGGAGNDTLIGLGGGDTFVFNTALNAATNHDTISDLAIGQDHIQLAKAVFSLLTGSAGATLAAGEFVSGPGLTNAQDANDRIVYNTTTGDLYYDTNGTAAGATLFATLSNHAAVNNTHFLLG